MIKKFTDLNLNLTQLEADVLLNKSLTNVSPTNMYEILFDCDNFDKILNVALEEIKNYTGNDLEVYVKNMWGYVQTTKRNESINFNIDFKNQVSVDSEYSFIYPVKSLETYVHLDDSDELVRQVSLNEGEMLIFKTKNFIKEECTDGNRIALVGSIIPISSIVKTYKKSIL
jgi:hypothetical protein